MAISKRDEAPYSSELNVHDVHTILGPESSFEGKLVFDGTVRIDGRFKGEIRTDGTLVIGQAARCEAAMFVGSVVINGEVVGDITAKQSVEIHAPGKVRGNITSPQLVITKDVIFEGTSKMEEAIRAHAASLPSAKISLLPNTQEGN